MENDCVATRRQFLSAAGYAAASVAALGFSPYMHETSTFAAGDATPRVAVIYTRYFHRSHPHVILENFLKPYYFNGQLITPPVKVASLYADQFTENDLGKALAAEHEIPLYTTIDQALCAGGSELAVDGVILIGEHGDYPTNKLGQIEYPRKRFFDETVAVFRRSKRVVPVFNDKHLSFRWDWAEEMYDVSRELGFPF